MYGDFFQRMAAARRQRRLERLSESMPEHLLRDIGLERDLWGRIHRVNPESRS